MSEVKESPNLMFQGYRQLSQAEIDLIAEVKEHAEQTRSLLARVEHFCIDRHDADKVKPDYVAHSVVTEPMRWAGVARTELQQGFMALTRAIAAPTSF